MLYVSLTRRLSKGSYATTKSTLGLWETDWMRDYATDYVTPMLEGGVRALIYAGDISTLYL